MCVLACLLLGFVFVSARDFVVLVFVRFGSVVVSNVPSLVLSFCLFVCDLLC